MILEYTQRNAGYIIAFDTIFKKQTKQRQKSILYIKITIIVIAKILIFDQEKKYTFCGTKKQFLLIVRFVSQNF